MLPKGTPLGKHWNKWNDDDLLRKVLGQGGRDWQGRTSRAIASRPETCSETVGKLRSLEDDAALQKYLHELFLKLKVRLAMGALGQKTGRQKRQFAISGS